MVKRRGNRLFNPPLPSLNKDMQNLEQIIRHSQSSILNPPISRYHSNIDEINFHFNGLKDMARRLAPHTLRKVDFLHKVVLDFKRGLTSDYEALEKIKSVIIREGLNPSIYNSAKSTLDAKHGKMPFMGMGVNPLNEFSNVKLKQPKPMIRQLKLRKPKKKRMLKPPFARLKKPRWF